MRIGKVIFNGVASDTLGVFISGAGAFDAAALDYVSYEIPGRSGNLTISNNRYRNIDVIYPAFIPSDFDVRVQSVRNWMRSTETYARISDNYDPDHYRMGIGKDILAFTPAQQTKGANFQLVFDCKPQRWLISGEEERSSTYGFTMTNPTGFDSRPLIKVTNVTSGGFVRFRGGDRDVRLTLSENYTGTITIDCENMIVYSGAQNLGGIVTGDFPLFAPGVNIVTFGNIESVAAQGRWWEL